MNLTTSKRKCLSLANSLVRLIYTLRVWKDLFFMGVLRAGTQECLRLYLWKRKLRMFKNKLNKNWRIYSGLKPKMYCNFKILQKNVFNDVLDIDPFQVAHFKPAYAFKTLISELCATMSSEAINTYTIRSAASDESDHQFIYRYIHSLKQNDPLQTYWKEI